MFLKHARSAMAEPRSHVKVKELRPMQRCRVYWKWATPYFTSSCQLPARPITPEALESLGCLSRASIQCCRTGHKVKRLLILNLGIVEIDLPALPPQRCPLSRGLCLGRPLHFLHPEAFYATWLCPVALFNAIYDKGDTDSFAVRRHMPGGMPCPIHPEAFYASGWKFPFLRFQNENTWIKREKKKHITIKKHYNDKKLEQKCHAINKKEKKNTKMTTPTAAKIRHTTPKQ